MTADLQPDDSKSPTRRALLAGALGGIGAWATSAIGRASPVRAADGDFVRVGNSYTGANETRITIPTGSVTALIGESNASGGGVEGISDTGIGVYGFSNSGWGLNGYSGSGIGVNAYSPSSGQPAMLGVSGGHNTGVQGVSGFPAPVSRPKTGVYGYAAQDSTSRGVWGQTTSGHAIHGVAAATGYAGYFSGRVYTTTFHEMQEIGNPSAPISNRARLYLRDTGGKTELCVRFHTGAIQVIATQP